MGLCGRFGFASGMFESGKTLLLLLVFDIQEVVVVVVDDVDEDRFEVLDMDELDVDEDACSELKLLFELIELNALFSLIFEF